MQAAIDADGNLHVARLARLGAYFGREIPRNDRASTAAVESRVVIQPDFSVIVIGLNPAPTADLAPFCERAAQRGGQGATLFKITRESVVKAVSHGLKPAEIMERLRRHGGKSGVPANVLKEVEEWSNWVRNVELTKLTVLRCPDAATADRVMSALKKQKAERINPTLVGLDEKNLSSADRAKLRVQGIIVQGQPEARTTKKKTRRRRW